MNNKPDLFQKRIAVTLALLLLSTICYDYFSIKKSLLGKAIEDTFIAAYPPVRLYRDYILRVAQHNPAATTNRFYVLPESEEDEKIVSLNAVALIDLDQGPAVVSFPKIKALENATVTFLRWDAITPGGESAYNTQYQITRQGSTEQNNPELITTEDATLLAFIRIPHDNRMKIPALPAILYQITIARQSTVAEATYSTPVIPVLTVCDDIDTSKIFIPCMDTLMPAVGISSAQAEKFIAARNPLGAVSNINRELFDRSAKEARLMISQVLTDGISLVTQNMWIAYEDMFTIKPRMLQLQLNRAAYAKANFVAAPSNKMKYAIKRYNARGEPVSGLQHNYELDFDPQKLPSEITEWHFIVRDESSQLFSSQKRNVISFNHALKREADGSIHLHFSSIKPAHIPDANWLPIPKDFFEIVFMGRGLTANPDFDYFEYLNELTVVE